ncbi:hypothetical protein A3K24_02320 [candidate division Kazan bacterium RIFCSPHIGHO2_01_FULL_44_14]|uniref:Next to BRCA1 central domain-containing protein n=1 Tax=candidate division Kazan bacterium RIFCSPLOWO2_01_FULL_45_19 TaxID=1798538 RepID=A0A1F4NQB9_UNCK3|nr:hypothetical protein [uncultured bacterium]AQS31077.1 hypothetical protein [uncultured bacterium]OGB73654.1 MAG: hypothetical protein A3K51_02320 [candidate division Kazan bacterium RIFCSPLOWO2_01_FULL_45_19]OGB77899.1 MAG: hypothetical protein A3K24_02320 [candidate division Kazan bacterium RIFCSPHIGHO2_01_FULL_44_14]
MIKQTQKFLIRLLEQELFTVLAILIVGSFGLWTRASDTATVTMNLTVLNPGGTITVLTPNGGENWTVGSSQNITWETTGTVTDVKIELQRSTGGSWETIIASTTNDGSYPWEVTEPTTVQALIKITEVGDNTVTDTSGAVFSIVSSGGGGGAGGGTYIPPAPAIDNITPSIVVNRVPVILDITGINFEIGVYFRLNGTINLQNPVWISPYRAQVTVPTGISVGTWYIWVYNPDGQHTVWGQPIQIVVPQYDAIAQDLPETIRFYLHPSETGQITLKFTNYSNQSWDARLKFGTVEPVDHNSLLYHAPTWSARNRAVNYRVTAVGYGGTVELPLTVQAPLQSGTYTDKFKLVLDGVAWLNMVPITVEVIVSPEIKAPPTTGGEELFYDAKFIAKSPNPRIVTGDEAELWVEFKNTGTIPWQSTGLNPVRLGTTHTRDRVSRFTHSTWIINNNRATSVGNAVVKPGEIGRFEFKIKAPTRTGYYREWFGLVAEFKQWFGASAEARWDISVIRRTANRVVAPSTGGTTTPGVTGLTSAGGSAPVVSVSDTSDLLWQILSGAVGRVMDSIGGLLRSWF